MNARRIYGRPPIIEAVCALNFSEAAEDWDLSSPVELYKELSKTYPGKPSQNFGAHLGVEEGDGGPSITVRPQEPILALSNLDGTKHASFGPESLTVRSTAPYEGWESFRDRLADAIASYQHLVTPSALVRAGVRYVNRFTFEGESVGLATYFTKPPESPDVPELEMVGFTSRVETIRPSDGVRIVSVYQSAQSEDNGPAVILDVDVSKQWDAAETVKTAWIDELEALRDLEREVFESLITDEARRLFNDN